MNMWLASTLHRLFYRCPKSVRRAAKSQLNRWGIEVNLHPPAHVEAPSEFRWIRPQTAPLQNIQLFLDVRAEEHRDMAAGTYDAFIYDTLNELPLTLAGARVWDVGAYIGYHTLAFAALVGPTGHVVAFEPNPHNVTYLHKHLEKNQELAGRITVQPLALSNTDGEHDFRCGTTTRLSFIGHLDQPASDRIPQARYDQLQTISVKTARIDSLIAQDMAPPDVIKIDVEGAEARVLEGARALLAAHSPVLVIEIHNITCMFMVQSLLFEYGYRLRLLNSGTQPAISRAFVCAIPQAL